MREGGAYRLHAGRLREGRGTMSISLHAACSTDITGLGKSIPSRARAAIACRCSSVLFMSMSAACAC